MAIIFTMVATFNHRKFAPRMMVSAVAGAVDAAEVEHLSA